MPVKRSKQNRPKELQNPKNAKKMADYIRHERHRSFWHFSDAFRRPVHTVKPLFRLAGLPPIENVIQKKISSNGKCSVFVIAPFKERAVLDLAARFGSKLDIIGMDIAKRDREDALHASKHYKVGNVLTKPFPKSDIVFSTFALGYIGHFDFMIKKISNALNADGFAVLHINLKGAVKHRSAVLVENPKALQSRIANMKLPACKINIFSGSEELPGFIVLVKKKPVPKNEEGAFFEEMERVHGLGAQQNDGLNSGLIHSLHFIFFCRRANPNN